MGIGSVALSSLLAKAVTSALANHPDGKRPIAKAKSVICLFMAGGVSQMESFDPKPALNEYANKSISETPFAHVVNSPFLGMNLDRGLDRKVMSQLFPMQFGFRKCGESGLELADCWKHLGDCADDMAVVRSMWTTDNNHQAQYQFLTGRNIVEGNFPSIGSWVHYGLGTLNENLPQFVVLGEPLGTCCGSHLGHGADYLGPKHAGVRINTEGKVALPYVVPEERVPIPAQAEEFDLLRKLNQRSLALDPLDAETEARIHSYELAFRMQMAVPSVVDMSGETEETLKLYGLDRITDPFAKQCLMARRFVEAGVRFVQVMHGAGGAGSWDGHAQLKSLYTGNCNNVDQPIAALLKDLKRRGLLDETLVVFATEFGRTPGLEVEVTPGSTNREGRDHHPFGFSIWMAGGGIKGGIAHGATDELGFHAVENRHYVTDVHATILNQLGLIPEELDLPGRQRLEKDHGHVIHEIIA